MTYRVLADIKYIDGALAGLTIPAGYSAAVPNLQRAIVTCDWLQRVERERDFVRAAVTGNRYTVVGNVTYLTC